MYIYSDVALDLEEPIVSSDNTMDQNMYLSGYVSFLPELHVHIQQEKNM
jgi:hypothetical protein